MKARDVEIGGEYYAKVSGRLVRVKVLREVCRTNVRGRVTRHWFCRNLATDRTIEVKSAQRLRCLYREPIRSRHPVV